MKKQYSKPKHRIVELDVSLLSNASDIHIGGVGQFDSKRTSFGCFDDDEYEYE